jgi:hypothetical protein
LHNENEDDRVAKWETNPAERMTVMDMFEIWKAYELIASPTDEEDEEEYTDDNSDRRLSDFWMSSWS